MEGAAQTNINRKLVVSFGLLIVIFLLFGLFTLYNLHTMSRLTRTIYNHPLVVSNAALQSNVSITKMHRNMKDVVLFRSQSKIQNSIDGVNQQEKRVYRYLDVVKNTILGPEGKQLEKEARALFENWRPIRDEVIGLVKTNQLEAAANITRGKGADHVQNLEDRMFKLTSYARNKATEFLNASEKTSFRHTVISVLFLFFGTLSSLLIAYFTVKQALIVENNLRNSEKRYRLLIETQTDLVSRLTPDGKFSFVNDVFCKFFNKSKEELIGKGWQPLPVDNDRAIIEQKLAALSPENPTVTIENRLFSGDHKVHWMQFVNQGFFDNQGKLLEVQSVGRDITDSKKVLNQINQQNTLIESINRIFIAAPKHGSVKEIAKFCLSIAENLTGSQYGSIAEVNENGKFNTIALSNPGWDRCEFLENDHDYIIQDMEIRGIWGAALDSKDGVIINDPATHPLSVGIPDGHPPLISFIGVPFRYDKINGVIGLSNKEGGYTDVDKDIIAALATPFIEVIERKRAEAALKESEAKYRSMMESMTDLVYICSPDFTVEYMNPAMIQRTGRNAVGESCHKALHELDTPCEWCVFDKVKLGNSIETHVVSPKDDRQYRVTNMPLHHDDGSISKMTIFRDITDYIVAVEEKEKAKTQLIQSQKMDSIGHLAGGIAHDFNNILSSIIGFTELALDDVDSGTSVEDSLQEVYVAGKRAKDLVKQILAFARQSDEELKPIRIDPMVKETLKLIRSTIPTTIQIRQSVQSPSLIMGNPTQINQILLNLCTNAAQAMEHDGGVMEVAIKDVSIHNSDNPSLAELKPGGYVEIKISDTGVGIAPDIINSIFDPYFSTKLPGKGTGMGLAMVHGIVESYQGKISVTSKEGTGSVFSVYLPITEKREHHRAYQKEPLPRGNERILVVDDEAPIARMTRKILERLGYDVTTKTSSLEALDLFHAQPDDFDLLITDMTMPEMTGDQLAGELMRIRPDLPIIACSGYSNRMSEKRATDYGFKDFAYKPIVKADLAQTVRSVLDSAKGSTQ